MRLARALALSSLLLVGTACQAFPEIPSGECGNGVIEPPEDCDGFALGAGTYCNPKDSVGECHLDCKQASCPSGWGCDADFICRQPTGNFSVPPSALDVGAWSLSRGDFDGDGRDDVMSSEPPDSIGATRVKFFYFDASGKLSDTHSFPKLIMSPIVGKFPEDSLSNVTFSEGPLGVMLGRTDRSWLPETFTSYRIDDVTVRVVAISDSGVSIPTAFVTLIGNEAAPGVARGSGFFVIDPVTGKPVDHAHSAWTIDDLAGDPVSGSVFEDEAASPCLDPTFALRNATHFSVLNTCQLDPMSGETKYRDPFERTDVALDPPLPIDSAPQLVDMNADGHLDVLLGAGGKPYVSYGDGSSLSVATPYRLTIANSDDISPEIPTPIAAGDFSGDGAPDFVFPDYLLISVSPPHAALPTYSAAIRNRLGAPITSAKIADFNGNGYLDVVTASSGSLNVQLFSGAEGPYFAGTTISTTASVQALATGDFDGDRINDLAVLETSRIGQSENTLRIAYGAPFAALLPLAPVAQVNRAAQVASFDSGTISGLAIASSDEIDGRLSGALTLLDGAPDRTPFAPFVLSEFSSNQSVPDSLAFVVSAGSFTGQSKGDLIALAFPPSSAKSDVAPPIEVWVVSDVRAPGAASRRLSRALDARLAPVSFLEQNSDFTADVVSASADLDRDGLDEAIFAMPAGPQQSRCGIVSIGASTAELAGVAPHEPALLDDPCPDPSILALDVDGDEFVDLLVLTGQSGATDRKLYVLWNDGTGAFSSADRALVSSPDDSPEAFTVLPASDTQPLRLVYVTRTSLQRVQATATPREFSTPTTLFGALAGGTGVTAADVNGDRVSDLVVAESGMLRVFLAQLVP